MTEETAFDLAKFLKEASDELAREAVARQQHVHRVDDWFEKCRLRAIATNPATYAQKGEPL